MPYGVETPHSSGISDLNLQSRNSVNYIGRKLPDKLRIVKPLEGSLTLNQWSRLATPHLGGVLEERVGVALKGNTKAGLDPLFEMYQLEDLEEEEDFTIPIVKHSSKPLNTLTNSTVLHPETTQMTSSYGGVQMSDGLSTRQSSRAPSIISSNYASHSDLPSLFNFPSDVKTFVARPQVDKVGRGQFISLTPSVLTSPYGSKNISPTETPCHTPDESLPGSPEEKLSNSLVGSFFSSLKTAILGEQRKEHKASKLKSRLKNRRGSFGIMETVEEIGVENLIGDKAKSPGLPNFEQKSSYLTDFDPIYLGSLDDIDELEDIEPGILTIRHGMEPERDPYEYTKQWIGELTVPNYGLRPSLHRENFGKLPQERIKHEKKGTMDPDLTLDGRGPGGFGNLNYTQTSMGVPGRPGTGALGLAIGEKRSDLGTVPGKDTFSTESNDSIMPMSHSTSFVGSFANYFFGRKGGYA